MIWRFTINDEVVENPIGWADAVFNFKRDRDLHGVFFEYSATLRFYGDGFVIIKEEYEASGVDGSLELLIEYQCAEGGDYAEFFTGMISISDIVFTEGDLCTADVSIGDNDCLSQLKNRQDQDVDLASLESFDGTALEEYDFLNKTISLESKTILKTDMWLYEIGQTGGTENATRDTTGVGLQEFEPYMWVKPPDNYNELGGINEDFIAGDTDTVADVPYVWTAQAIPGVVNPAWNFRVKGKANISITGFLDNVTLDGCDPTDDKFEDVIISLQFYRFRPSDLSNSTHTIGTTTFSGCHQNLNEDLEFDFDGAYPSALLTGDQIALFWRVQVSGEYTKIVPLSDSEITINFTLTDTVDSFFEVTLETNTSATDAKVNLVNEALSRTVEAITDGCMKVRSDYFGRTDSEPYAADSDGCGSLECITSGLLIRRKETATHKISFKTLYDGLNAIHNLGMSIEEDPDRSGFNQVRIEDASYFYNDTIIMSCPNVPQIKRSAITDELYSLFKIGYQKWEAESFNGLDEFCTSRKYRTTLKNVKNTLSKISSLIASGYAIELTRQQYGQTSKDWRYDNDNFIICLERFYLELIVEQGNITSAANLIDPASVYNFRISPLRNLLRWMPKVMASYLDATVSGALLFSSGTGNTEAEGFINDACAAEEPLVLSEQQASISIENAQDETAAVPIYKPELWEFEYPMSVEEYVAVKANPLGIIQVQYGQNTIIRDCYIREIKYKPEEGKATFMLIPKYPGVGSIDYIITEDGITITTEDGVGLIVE